MDPKSVASDELRITPNKFCKPQNRECPECGFTTIHGMPGGRDATCTNCGYKDPCCYD